MLFKNIFNEYLKYLKVYRKEGTYIYYDKSFKSLLICLETCKLYSSSNIRKDFFNVITEYYLKIKKKKNSQINNIISCLISALNFSGISYPKRHKLIDDTKSYTALSEYELDSLLFYLSETDISEYNKLSIVLGVYLFLETGVRLSELLNIKKENVDMNSKSIYLVHTKNGHGRYVFFGKLSYQLLKKVMQNNNEYIIWDYMNDRQLTKTPIYKFFNKVNQSVNSSQRIHPHRLRKTFATGLLHKGCNLAVISKLLGHRDVKQTMIYLRIDNRLLSNEYEKFYPY